MLTRLLRQNSMALHRLYLRRPCAFASSVPLRFISAFSPTSSSLPSSRPKTCPSLLRPASSRGLHVPALRAAVSSSSPSAKIPDSPSEHGSAGGDGDAPTAESLQRVLKRHAGAKAVRKLITTIQDAESGAGPWGSAGVHPDAVMYRTAIRGLVSAARPELALELYETRVAARRARPADLYADLPLASSALRSLCRNSAKRNMLREGVAFFCDDMLREAAALGALSADALDGLGTALPRQAVALMTAAAALLGGGDRDKVIDAARAQDMVQAVQELSKKVGHRVAAEPADYNSLIRVLGKTRQLGTVFDVVEAMEAAGVDKDNETFEFLANATLRQVRFVTGAVSMETLPTEGLDEVAFVGRSNVGKSSLINMLCNRRALAYVSGRPGKTQQFNYFLVNELDKTNQFFLVDLPGVGYAKVPTEVRNQWMMFMGQYLLERETLRVVFHLVDGRHGALADDEILMNEMGRIVGAFRYVVVLTKMDKMDKQKVKRSVMDKTREALRRNGCTEGVPIIATSSTSKLGRDELWWHLLHALNPAMMKQRNK